ncbi:LysM domain-containing protein [Daldinia childiae]|uniref:LysM domain-containing protein n=1 Tax=Daldinia childiae TaxID=326645 RepID=UPI0014488C5A|nr:LysM domain-containing protein [Daldinia childiae]KAF3055159.1 LysM domain-containing protein [Daldinia childiae]
MNILSSVELITLCGSSCQDDLRGLRTTIKSSCTSSNDVVMPGGIIYPATFLVDRFIYAAELSCLKDSNTGEYCDLVVATWLNQTDQHTTIQNCSECELALQAKQLASPFGFSEEAASEFASTTSSCQASQYMYSIPTQYGLNATITAPLRPACADNTSYIIRDGDSCNSIAGANNISTESLISLNGIDLACNTMPAVGTTICLPTTCKIRELAVNDTCGLITADENITIGQLLAWNPIISPGCANLNSWRGRFLCVSSPRGTVVVPNGNAVTTTAPLPTNKQSQSNLVCGKWYTVQPDDSCAIISLSFGISLADFYFLNQQIDAPNCTNLWLGYAYCVKAVGNIETYPGYSITTPLTTFTRPPPLTLTTTAVALPSLLPRALGTIDGCFYYEDAWDTDVVAKIPDMNSCKNWASAGDVTVAELIVWNPSLSAENCVLQSGKSYCIQKEDISMIGSDPDPDTEPEPDTPISTPHSISTFPTETAPSTTTGTSMAPPSPTQPGAITTCKVWHTVIAGDGCWAIANGAGISVDDFYKWNPGVGSDCSALWLGYAVCIGI